MKRTVEAIRNYFKENASVISGAFLMMNGNVTAYHLYRMSK